MKAPMGTKRRSAICLLITTFGPAIFGCATEESVQSLEKRVSALEEKQKAKAAEDQDRQSKLENCINVESDQKYWSYIELNGHPVSGKPGTYTAPGYVWDNAEKQKKDKVEECKLLYGLR
jgi:hypothetical protein